MTQPIPSKVAVAPVYEVAPLVQAVEELDVEVVSNTTPVVALQNETITSHSNDSMTEVSSIVMQRGEPDEEEHNRRVVIGAGVASGLAGCLWCGPWGALACYAGATHAVTQAEEGSCLKDSFWAVGELAVSAADKAQWVNGRHHVVEQSTVVAGQAWEQAQRVNQEHQVGNKAKNFIASTLHSGADFMKRNRIVERGVDATGKVIVWTGQQLASRVRVSTSSGKNSSNDNNHKKVPASTAPQPVQ